MRIAALLPCLLLTACLADGGQPAPPMAATAPPTAIRVEPAPAPPATAGTSAGRRANGGGSSAGGGATTAAARSEPPVEVGPDTLTQVRADCWMKVEHEKGARDIDRRAAFVEKCVAEKMKAAQ